MSKSYVSMAKAICPVCGLEHEPNEILIDRRLKDSMETYTNVGWRLCPEHQALCDQGYTHLVVASDIPTKERVGVEEPNRTGEILSVKVHVFEQMFECEHHGNPMAFITQEAAELVKSMYNRALANSQANNKLGA